MMWSSWSFVENWLQFDVNWKIKLRNCEWIENCTNLVRWSCQYFIFWCCRQNLARENLASLHRCISKRFSACNIAHLTVWYTYRFLLLFCISLSFTFLQRYDSDHHVGNWFFSWWSDGPFNISIYLLLLLEIEKSIFVDNDDRVY